MQNPMMMTDRVIMVTGGGQGIGRQLAEQLLSLEAQVALVDIDADVLAEAREALGPDRVQTYCGDVSDAEFVNSTVENIVTDLGGIHGLINNAGIVRAAMASEMSLEQWQQVIGVNLTGAFICLQAVGKQLISKAKNGDPNPGSIVNISSDAGRRGTIGQINYGAAKSGVLGLTMCSAREWGRYNINVNSVCYGMVETAMTETIRQEKFRDKYLSQIPLGRFSTTEDVAPATCFLLCDAASYITGQHLSIDGGFYISS
ncbi:3-oxoacyl-[acyl-carrier-protein] reductase FabG [Halioglobus japonicus]|nr:3-oxoacyl-[acyl-carrier-protein] reductase FabG [Halioglobus japonicus]